jgi:hypothetical protein
MTKTLGIGTIPNYRVSVTLGMVVVQGQVLRNEGITGITLGSKIGVERYIKECGNIVSLKVTDLNTGKDISDEFKQYATFVHSRYGQPIRAYDLRKL